MIDNARPPALDAIKDALFELSELPEPARAERLAAWAEQSPALALALAGLLPGGMATVDGVRAPARWLNELTRQGLPQQLGRWRVLREIGRGGMGVVVLGERADGAFDKQVAIKVLPPVLAGAEGTRRLEAEAQALAGLEHPHIARLLDAGVDQGCAFMVMERVAGLPLTTHAQARGLNTRQKLGLVLQLCSAVQFAHGRLLVHRDIKPDNVLVDGDGQVRLLDFGIAKVLSAGPTAATLQAAFTPAYASPEQLLGQPASVAGDVYSLGVLLFELLTGQHPFWAKASAVSDTASALAQMRAVLDGQPDRAALRRAQVGADLQAVVMKALEKPLDRRYTSVDALASDLQAVLDERPVQAQAPHWRYIATRFVQRHRWPVLGTSLATAAVLGLTVWALHSAQQARQQKALAQARLQTVRAIANKVVFDYNAALEAVPGTLALRKTLVTDALTYLAAMTTDARGDAALEADVAAGYEAVGDVQGRGVTGGNLGDLPAAQRSYERAQALRRPWCEGRGDNTAAAAATAAAKTALGIATGAANTAANGAASGPAQVAQACSAWAATLVRLGDNAFTQGRTEDGIAHFEKSREASAQALAVPLPPGDPQRHAALDLRSQVNQRLAGLSLRQTGAAFDRGLALARDQLSAAQALAQEVPGPKSQETLRVAHDFLAVRLLSEGQPAQALPHSEKAVELARSLLPVRPARDAGVALASSLVRLAEIQAHLLQPAQATARLEEALALVRGLHMAEPDDRHLRARYANVGWRVGEVNHLMGHAAALQSNATVLPEVLLAADFKPADGVFYMQRKRVQQELARTKLRRGDAAGALRSLADFAAQMPPHPVAAADLAEVFLLRAQALTALNQRGPAGQALEAGFAAIQAAHGATPGNVQLACRWLQLRMQFAAALAPTPVADEPVGPAVAALQRQGKLSPYWAQALQAAPP